MSKKGNLSKKIRNHCLRVPKTLPQIRRTGLSFSSTYLNEGQGNLDGSKLSEYFPLLLGTSRYSQVLPGSPGTHGYFWVLPGISGYFWVFPGTSGYFRVLPGTSWYFWILPLPGTFGYFLVLLAPGYFWAPTPIKKNWFHPFLVRI